MMMTMTMARFYPLVGFTPANSASLLPDSLRLMPRSTNSHPHSEPRASQTSPTSAASHQSRRHPRFACCTGTVALDAIEHNSGGHRWALDVPKLRHSTSSRAPGTPRSAPKAVWPSSTKQCHTTIPPRRWSVCILLVQVR